MYWRISTTAVAALPNIMPMISTAMMSFSRAVMAMMTSRMRAAPIQADPTMPRLPHHTDEGEMPSRGMPSVKRATPRLAPELTPST